MDYNLEKLFGVLKQLMNWRFSRIRMIKYSAQGSEEGHESVALVAMALNKEDMFETSEVVVN